MPYDACYDEEAGDDVNHHPEGLEEQSYPCFPQC